ncbi:MAG: hypothetical protein ABW360_09030, partial [Phenylobacterium sp.]
MEEGRPRMGVIVPPTGAAPSSPLVPAGSAARSTVQGYDP